MGRESTIHLCLRLRGGAPTPTIEFEFEDVRSGKKFKKKLQSTTVVEREASSAICEHLKCKKSDITIYNEKHTIPKVQELKDKEVVEEEAEEPKSQKSEESEEKELVEKEPEILYLKTGENDQSPREIRYSIKRNYRDVVFA